MIPPGESRRKKKKKSGWTSSLLFLSATLVFKRKKKRPRPAFQKFNFYDGKIKSLYFSLIEAALFFFNTLKTMGGSHLPDSRPTEINKIQILIFLGFLIVFLFFKKRFIES